MFCGSCSQSRTTLTKNVCVRSWSAIVFGCMQADVAKRGPLDNRCFGPVCPSWTSGCRRSCTTQSPIEQSVDQQSAILNPSIANRQPAIDLVVVRSRLPERPRCPFHQVRFDEDVYIPVENPIDVPDLLLRAVILDELIGMQDVAADLVAEGEVLLLAAELIQPGLLFPDFQIVQPRFEDLHRRVAVPVLGPLVLRGYDDAR